MPDDKRDNAAADTVRSTSPAGEASTPTESTAATSATSTLNDTAAPAESMSGAGQTDQMNDRTETPLRPFFTLWTGQTLSLLGSAAVQFALIWWVTKETGSATILATATLVGLVPQVVLGPVIGALVDRWSRKTIMLVADGVIGLASLVLAGLFLRGSAGPEHVLVLLFVRALGAAFHGPAMKASTTLMVPERLFTQIQGLNQSLEGLVLIVGAPLGALLYATLPMAQVMMLDVGTALLAIVPLIFIHVPRPRASSESEPSVWQEMMAGFSYLRDRKGHLTLIGIAAVLNLMLVPAFSLLPLLVLERLHGDAAQFGWSTSIFGVGMLAGGILLGVWGGFARRIVTTLLGMVALGLAVLAVGVTPEGNFTWLLGAMLAVGMMVPLVNGPVHAILQATIAPEFQGRVFTLLASLAGIMAPLGLLFAAPVAELVGVGTWYVAGGMLCVSLGALGFLLPTLMRIEGDEPVECAAG
ncbi:MAG: MFS transporter [Gemmatimonadota bacterium]|nr:MAG: MFS transporter [Gemmatimonadota bacterium]